MLLLKHGCNDFLIPHSARAGTSIDGLRSAIASGEQIMQSSFFLQNAANCDELASEAHGPRRARLERLARGWRAVAETQDWLDGRMPPVDLADGPRAGAGSAGRNSPE